MSKFKTKCCWYCKHLKKCQRACINNPLYCIEFCAWFMDEDCEDFEFDERKYRDLRAQFTDTALEEVGSDGY